MARIYVETLSREVKENLKNRAYSVEQVAEIHSLVKERHLQKETGFLRAAIIISVLTVSMFLLTIISGPSMPVKLIIWMGSLMFCLIAAILLMVKSMANKMTNQFVSALRAGYPELEEQFGKASFKK